MVNIKRILVPTNFTETSNLALDYALELAERMSAEVTVMHAFEIPLVGFPDGALVMSGDVARRVADVSREALESLVAERSGKGVKLHGVLREGVPSEEINKLADEENSDMIVIGTQGRRGIARALLGSIAESVIRTTKHPVLCIHGAS
jgi:nucleotide-binding universal stress UspA family protein